MSQAEDSQSNPGEGKVGRRTREKVASKGHEAPPSSAEASLEGRIRERAYQLYLERGYYFRVDENEQEPTAGLPMEATRITRLDRQTVEYASVLAHAVDTFGSRTRANAWLNRPNRIFNNQSPLQVLTQDPAAVEEELVRIDHGMFA
jgi:hypothetical protein